MSNLEHKTRMSPWQLSIVLIEICVGISMVSATSDLAAAAKEATWLSVILGGIIFGSAALLMVKLGSFFPEETLVEYMPKVWGSFFGSLAVWYLNITMILMFIMASVAFNRTITFFLFDRTPNEVVALSMMIVCVYAALQSFGTILRMLQILFFTITPFFVILWLLSLINFQQENLLPIYPEDISAMLMTSFNTWTIYGGYEFILLLLPLVYAARKINIYLSVCGAFGCMTCIYTILVVIAIGVVSAEQLALSPYSLLDVIRGIRIPGTFLERLEGYFLMFWIPMSVDTYLMLLWGNAQILMRQYKCKDHRPFVLILAPLIYTATILLDNLAADQTINKLTIGLGLIFSLVIVPISVIIAWRQNRRDTTCKNDKAV